MADAIDRFLEILEQDAQKYDGLADNLRALMPHFEGEQREWAKAEVARRQGYASELRQLAIYTREKHGR